MCFVIDYVNIPNSHLVDLQASIDAQLSHTTCVVGFIDRTFADRRSEDFFSRWMRRVRLQFDALNDEHHAIASSKSGSSQHVETLNLHSSSRWESVFFGRVRFHDGQWVLQPGAIQSILEKRGSQPLHLHLINPPTSIAAFNIAWESLLRNRGFTWYGAHYPIPQNFSWSFQTTAEGCNLPLFRGVTTECSFVWFVCSSTVAFLQPFTYLLPNGSFAQHEGYLQQMKSSGAEVVLDSLLSPNELSHIISGDLNAFKGSLFLSDPSIHSLEAGLADRVKGRAVHFSLGERITASLIVHPEPGKHAFEETGWLRDLETERNEFTIVLPIDHPDTRHVLNWIKYRQIWFPHRAVHIKARLHVMHTERLDQCCSTGLDTFCDTALVQLESLLRREWLLLLSGPPGCGKTTLASRFHRHNAAKREGGLAADTPKSDDVASPSG